MITFTLKTNIPLKNHFGFPESYLLAMYECFLLKF